MHIFEVCKHLEICYINDRKGQDHTRPRPVLSFLYIPMRDDHAQDRLAENAGRFFHEVIQALVDRRERASTLYDGFYQICHSGLLLVGQFGNVQK